MKHYGDITKLRGNELEPVDVITGGSPCQDLSIAGTRKGFGGERSVLFMEQVRIIKEMRVNASAGFCRPQYMVWENVPGAFSSRGGEDFKAVLEETIKIVEPEIPALSVPEKGWPNAGLLYDDMGGWSVAWRVHDAQFWGVPQRRRRIALVADFGGLSAGEILFERKGLRGSAEASRETREAPAEGTQRCFDARGNGGGETVCTITGDHAGHMSDYTPLTFAKQSNAGWKEAAVSATLSAQGNAVSNGGGEALVMRERNGKPGGGKGPLLRNGLSGTLGTSNDQALIYSLRGNIIERQPQNGGNGKGYAEDIIGTLNTVDRHAVVYDTVRRLTPLECERLQGFPDGWTDIGNWTDDKGRTRPASDAARYKALGNSIALPYWKVLARKIAAQYDRDITMGSLFDGIGGFPLAFEHCGVKCLWASEIEPFCTAVTKYHFGEE